MAADDKYSVILITKLGTKTLANTFFTKVVDDSGYTDKYAGVAEQFEDDVIATLKGVWTTEVSIDALLVRQLAPVTAPTRVFELSDAGTASGQALPSNQVMDVEHVSALGISPQRGRWFFSGCPETWISEGRWRVGDVAAFNSFLAISITTYGVATKTYQLQHYSPTQDVFYDVKRSYLLSIPRKLRQRTQKLY